MALALGRACWGAPCPLDLHGRRFVESRIKPASSSIPRGPFVGPLGFSRAVSSFFFPAFCRWKQLACKVLRDEGLGWVVVEAAGSPIAAQTSGVASNLEASIS